MAGAQSMCFPTTPRSRALSTILIASAALAILLPAPAAAAPPRVQASWVSGVTASSADLRAQADPEGLATTYRFQYLTAAAYEANLAAGRERFAGAAATPPAGGTLGAGTQPQNLLAHVAGLASSTAYRYRILLESNGGIVAGPPRPLETEESAPIFALPDGRNWEMVSPVDKDGGAVQGPGANQGGDELKAAAGGGAVTYSSSSSFGTGAAGAPAASQYLAGRAAVGWSTQNITVPESSAAEPAEGGGVPFRAFSDDLLTALVSGGGACLTPTSGCANPSPPPAGSGGLSGYQDYYLRDQVSGAYRALITAASSPALSLPAEVFSVSLAGATPDLAHVLISTCAALVSGAVQVPEGTGCNPADQNLYEWGEGRLELVNEDSDEVVPAPYARLAAPSGAVSADGSRVYWVDTTTGDLWLHEARAGEQAVDGGVGGGGEFQAGGADGRVCFFTKAGHLYRYEEASGHDTDLTPLGEVEGVLGAAADGTRVYLETSSGLYLWEEGMGLRNVAVEAEPVDWPPATGQARVSDDGRYVVFSSSDEETGFDNTDSGTEMPDHELYLYDADAGTLTCASCNPTGERPIGSASLPGASVNGDGASATELYRPRAFSASGRRLFFDSKDALALQDTNGRPDVYEWEAGGEGSCAKPAGCISLISSGRDPEASQFIDASAPGSDVFFLTDGSLVPSDPGSYDVYDAREGVGFPVAATPIPCNGDACQPLPSPPEDPVPGTLVRSPGNPAPKIVETGGGLKHKHHQKKKRHRARKHRGAPDKKTAGHQGGGHGKARSGGGR
jgi:hypothetical protein